MAKEDFNAARDIIARAVQAGKITIESALKAESFIRLESNRKPEIKRNRVQLAVCYCLMWFPAVAGMAYTVIHRMHVLGLLR
jgi:hypothetical protein